MENKEVTELIEQGKFYFLNKRYNEAILEFQKALKLDPKNARILYELGAAHEGNGDIEITKVLYLKALEIDPKLKEAQERLDELVGISEKDKT